MSICQLGMHKNVQNHTNANVCKQTYDASCTATVPNLGKTSNRFCVVLLSRERFGKVFDIHMPKGISFDQISAGISPQTLSPDSRRF